MEPIHLLLGGIILWAAAMLFLNLVGRHQANQKAREAAEERAADATALAEVERLSTTDGRPALERLVALVTGNGKVELRRAALRALAGRASSSHDHALLVEALSGQEVGVAKCLVQYIEENIDNRWAAPLAKVLLSRNPISSSQPHAPQTSLQIALLSRFGDASAVLYLIDLARQTSGGEAGTFYSYGKLICTGECSNAVDAIAKILSRDATHASEADLHAILALNGLTEQPFPHSEHDSRREAEKPVSCSTIHHLARQELERRNNTPPTES